MKRKTCLLLLLLWCMQKQQVLAAIYDNPYVIENSTCPHTIIDTVFTNTISYVGYKNADLFKVNSLLDNSSYRLKQEILTLVTFINPADTSAKLRFYATRYRFIQAGEVQHTTDSTVQLRHSENIIINKQFLEITVPPAATLQAYFIFKPISFKDYYSSKNYIYRYNDAYQLPDFDERTERETIGFCALILLLLGIIIVLSIFYGLAYINLREKIYLSYTVYLLITFLQVLYMAQYTFAKSFKLFNYIGNSCFDECTKGLMVIAYCIFLIQALGITKKYKIAFYATTSLIVISALYVLFMLIAYIFRPDFYFEPSYFIAYRLPLFVLSTLLITASLFIKNKTSFQRLILVGSWLYTLFAIFSMLQDFNFPFEDMLVSIHGLYLGVALELLVFSIALAMRIRDTYRESERLKDVYIKELQDKEEFIKNENQMLEEKVKERVEEIHQQSILIEEQKRQALIQSYEKEKLEIQLQALSSQMNPHFIFNCMNSIQHLIITNQTDKASLMLHDFATLIRMVLEYSSQPDILLEDEIKLINMYLKLEQERTNNSFDFEVKVDDNVAMDFIRIPTMLLQPFLENALWHGFKFITYKGKITVHISVIEQQVYVEITDNGIGRSKAMENKLRYRLAKNKSIAINIIQNRIELLNQAFEDQQARLLIEDLTDENNNPAGTRITLYLPII